MRLLIIAIMMAMAPMANTQDAQDNKVMTPDEMLKSIQLENDALLKRQQELLTTLEALEKESGQLRIFAKRS